MGPIFILIVISNFTMTATDSNGPDHVNVRTGSYVQFQEFKNPESCEVAANFIRVNTGNVNVKCVLK